MIMPFGGIIRTQDLDWKHWMWHKLPLLMSPPIGGKPSIFLTPGNKIGTWGVLHILLA